MSERLVGSAVFKTVATGDPGRVGSIPATSAVQQDEGERLEVIEVDQPDSPPPSRTQRVQRPRTPPPPWFIVTSLLSCVVALGSAALVWRMRAQRNDARRDERALAVEHQVPTQFVTGAQFVGHFTDNDGATGMTLVLTRTKTPRPAVIAVAQIFGEPVNAVLRFTFFGCGGSSLIYTPAHGGSETPEVIPNFPYLKDGDEPVVDVFIYRPPAGSTADAAHGIHLGGVRGPFGSQTRLAPGRTGCQ